MCCCGLLYNTEGEVCCGEVCFELCPRFVCDFLPISTHIGERVGSVDTRECRVEDLLVGEWG